jgi:hypothetical protein
MLRSRPFPRKKPLRRTKADGLAIEREPHPIALKPIERSVSYEGTTNARPKNPPHRDPVLLEMQRGRPCKFLAVEACETTRGESTVAAHENEGKGMGIKASDAKSAGACYPCHVWYDQSAAPKAEKRRAFMVAHLRQVLEWREIVSNPAEPKRYRKAAQRALDALNATQVGGN